MLPSSCLLWQVRRSHWRDIDALHALLGRGNRHVTRQLINLLPYASASNGISDPLLASLLALGFQHADLVGILIDLLQEVNSRKNGNFGDGELIVHMLGTLGSPSAKAALIDNLTRFPSFGSQEHSLRKIGVPNAQIVDAYVLSLSCAEPMYRRYWAAERLAKLGDPRALPSLRRLQSETPQVTTYMQPSYALSEVYEMEITTDEYMVVSTCIAELEARL